MLLTIVKSRDARDIVRALTAALREAEKKALKWKRRYRAEYEARAAEHKRGVAYIAQRDVDESPSDELQELRAILRECAERYVRGSPLSAALMAPAAVLRRMVVDLAKYEEKATEDAMAETSRWSGDGWRLRGRQKVLQCESLTAYERVPSAEEEVADVVIIAGHVKKNRWGPGSRPIADIARLLKSAASGKRRR